MQIPPIQRQVHAEAVPIEKLGENKSVPQEEKIAEVSRQFEAILLRQIFGESTKNMLGSSANAAVYHDLVTWNLADKVSHSGGLGLAEKLERELGRNLALKRQDAEPAPETTTKHANVFPHLHKH